MDIAFWAHEHSYERLWPVYNRRVYNGSFDKPYTNPKAPIHIITGSAGCNGDHESFDKKMDPWSAFHSDHYGFTHMKVYNSTHLYMEHISDNRGGAIIDKLMIIKDSHGPYPYNPEPIVPVGDPLKKLRKHRKDHIDNKEQLR